MENTDMVGLATNLSFAIAGSAALYDTPSTHDLLKKKACEVSYPTFSYEYKTAIVKQLDLHIAHTNARLLLKILPNLTTLAVRPWCHPMCKSSITVLSLSTPTQPAENSTMDAVSKGVLTAVENTLKIGRWSLKLRAEEIHKVTDSDALIPIGEEATIQFSTFAKVAGLSTEIPQELLVSVTAASITDTTDNSAVVTNASSTTLHLATDSFHVTVSAIASHSKTENGGNADLHGLLRQASEKQSIVFFDEDNMEQAQLLVTVTASAI
ncbi:hypothetical protein CC80DRAFT_543148 [Byssothecium circinans]|uniref:Uncharacterized protein n=1 Tax=Byssothecium circinans TaxID=147558 RepID=A0A6A5UAP6_9PLEO|nr:hypothetical protein CC80DRAFT_543148 [Byssothecium circinans]